MKSLTTLRTTLRRAAAATALIATAGAPLAASAAEPTLPVRGPASVHAAEGIVTARGDIVVLNARVFDEARTVAVQPVFFGGARAEAAWYDLALGLEQGKADAGAVASLAANPLDLRPAEGGFGFAGAASDADLDVLRVAVGLGQLLALRGVGDAAGAAALERTLRQQGAAFGVLTRETQGAIGAILGGGERLVGVALGAALQAGLRGIPARERAHGYVCAGVWASAAQLVAARGGHATFAAMAEPLAQLLDKDAAFGSADRKVAAALRAIAAELGAARPDVGRVRAQVEIVLQVARG
jgi:hypothetical protein